MRKMTTKHGHEWMMPETQAELEAMPGYSKEVAFPLTKMAMQSRMCGRSFICKKKGKEFNPRPFSCKQKLDLEDTATLVSRLSVSQRAALEAELAATKGK